VAIVERLKRWRGLARLRRAVDRSPTPASFADLAERQIALGEIDEALRTAEEGLELYPESDRLVHVRAYAKKGRLSGQIRGLKDDVARRPTPLAYAQLAQLYRELGGHDEALAIAAECSARFPLNEAGYVVQGEIRAERFRRDLVARDAVIAEEALTKVVRLNPQNAAARLLLAELHWLVGDAAGCREHLGQALAISPTAADAAKFLADLEEPHAAAGASAAPFDSLAQVVEENRAFAGDPSRFPASTERASKSASSRSRFDAEGVKRAMEALGEREGVKNAVLLDKDGASVAEFAREGGLAPAGFIELVTGVRDVADDASRRMDTGALVRVEIEGPGGNVAVALSRGFTVAILYAAPLRVERALEFLQDLVARTPASAHGEARA
jgi:tetratricopeptide (TPR) repeat protein